MNNFSLTSSFSPLVFILLFLLLLPLTLQANSLTTQTASLTQELNITQEWVEFILQTRNSTLTFEILDKFRCSLVCTKIRIVNSSTSSSNTLILINGQVIPIQEEQLCVRAYRTPVLLNITSGEDILIDMKYCCQGNEPSVCVIHTDRQYHLLGTLILSTVASFPFVFVIGGFCILKVFYDRKENFHTNLKRKRKTLKNEHNDDDNPLSQQSNSNKRNSLIEDAPTNNDNEFILQNV